MTAVLSLPWLQFWDMPWRFLHPARDTQNWAATPPELTFVDDFRRQFQVASHWDATLPPDWALILSEKPEVFNQRLRDVGVLCTVGYWGKDLGGVYFRGLVEQFGTAFLRGLLQRWQPVIGNLTTDGSLSVETAGALALRAALLPRFSKTWTRVRLRLPPEVDRPNQWSPPPIAMALEGWQLGWKANILSAPHTDNLPGASVGVTT